MFYIFEQDEVLPYRETSLGRVHENSFLGAIKRHCTKTTMSSYGSHVYNLYLTMTTTCSQNNDNRTYCYKVPRSIYDDFVGTIRTYGKNEDCQEIANDFAIYRGYMD